MTQKRKIAKTDLPELLTRAELAELYGMSVKTLANWATMGIGPSPIKLGKEVRYHPEDVWNYLEERRAA
ncbi:helix-turn-helix domain-containing protein [Nesterenkonia salmonea]|uniref:Helix-turn-helix domain-containing protein n=1 Tax=Nesterenkonia salmonea TaxID=1804987 RepID=A0A5R9B8F2_9MICC|nr:helix-turn-helix domain-containing protein [Nesterenkonia salmonea]TLP94276.1 helix-turn-helix domain-containing protein [Nesterenkonia salmonea]